MEVFEPELPTTCRSFLNRCNPGAQDTFKGTKVDRVVENYALFGGINRGWASNSLKTAYYSRRCMQSTVLEEAKKSCSEEQMYSKMPLPFCCPFSALVCDCKMLQVQLKGIALAACHINSLSSKSLET